MVKNQGQRALAEELAGYCADLLNQQWKERPITAVFGVPSSRQGRRFRGFSLPALLETTISRECGWAPLEPEMRAAFPEHQRSSRGQSLNQRLAKRGTLGGSTPACGPSGTLLLIDDVLTSGATLSRAVETARKLGWQSICCLVVAVAPMDENS